ncbi:MULTISPECIES: methylenetetrahydrofolate--tRNA-(uracil-5-)-methyltransferase [unclassified Corynebacterium]|uniref:methylenetetrahydrofolate--tRNA-(uracil-5-)- methyltransferase n=1 Tax=unclassified Corynebacterium TaxID=2624378 RepID=UPI0034CD4AFB
MPSALGSRVAVIGDGPAALSATERLIGAGMCVDLISSRPAPFGFLRHFAASGTAADGTPHLRLIGNVRVGVDGDITHRELHALSNHPDPDLLVLELHARGLAITTWEGCFHPAATTAEPTTPTDWDAVINRASLAPLCF